VAMSRQAVSESSLSDISYFCAEAQIAEFQVRRALWICAGGGPWPQRPKPAQSVRLPTFKV
jgi:hypothetical protein